MDCPYEPIFNAAFYHLYNWAVNGVPAPHAPKLQTEMTYTAGEVGGFFGNRVRNITDTFGNACGGIRHPAVDFPTGTYTSFSRTKNGGIQEMFGHVVPFSPEKLAAIYGNLENYRRLVTESTNRAVAQGFVLPSERDGLIERVVETARRRGLR